MNDKHAIADALRETAQLLKAKGANKFKIKAYVSAAKVLDATPEDLSELIAEERLTELPGVGNSIAGLISELYYEGETNLLNKLRQELPPGTAQLISIDGMTLKRIQALSEKLHVTSVKELEEACKQGKLADLKGFGEKVQSTLLNSIQNGTEVSDEMRLFNARPVVKELLEFLSLRLPKFQFEIAGGVRAWDETVKKIEIVTTANAMSVSEVLANFQDLVSITEAKDLITALLWNTVPIEITCVNNLALGLVAKTGSPEHFMLLEKAAREKGFHLTITELKRDKTKLPVKSELDVYKSLDLNFIPPEMRQGKNEIELAESDDFSDLIEIDDIRGMTHCHTTYSDGVNTVEQMVRGAEEMGMDYLTITDHSPTAHYAGGLTIDELKEQWEEIDRVQQTTKVKILKGTECDILADGRLDYPDNILEKFDIIIASIHSRYRQGEELMTKRLLTALRNPHFKIWGHPLGRIVLSRPPIPCDVANILEAVADANVAIEINGDPYRMDLPSYWSKIANELGFKFIISTDAHSTGNYRNLKYGIHLARRAGIRRQSVLNALSASKFKKAVSPT